MDNGKLQKLLLMTIKCSMPAANIGWVLAKAGAGHCNINYVQA